MIQTHCLVQYSPCAYTSLKLFMGYPPMEELHTRRKISSPNSAVILVTFFSISPKIFTLSGLAFIKKSTFPTFFHRTWRYYEMHPLHTAKTLSWMNWLFMDLHFFTTTHFLFWERFLFDQSCQYIRI